jgi:hypothetical protein
LHAVARNGWPGTPGSGRFRRLIGPRFDSPLREAAERRANLPRYVERMMARYYPDQAEVMTDKVAA